MISLASPPTTRIVPPGTLPLPNSTPGSRLLRLTPRIRHRIAGIVAILLLIVFILHGPSPSPPWHDMRPPILANQNLVEEIDTAEHRQQFEQIEPVIRTDITMYKVPGGRPMRLDSNRPLNLVGPPPKPLADLMKEYADLPVRLPSPYPQHTREFPSNSNPWPGRPKITQEWLTPTKTSFKPAKPSWPDVADIPNKLLSAIKPIEFKNLVVPSNYVPHPRPGRRKDLPKVQFDFKSREESQADREERLERLEWVRKAIIHAWEGYKTHAWGHDELKPVTKKGGDTFNGWGATLVDSLDTLVIAGLHEEYALARTHVQALDFTQLSGSGSAYGRMDGITLPTFETNIRYLGGLLGAYDLTGDSLMLDRAKELGDWMLGAFGTRSGLPMGRYGLGSNPMGRSNGRAILSEVGTMALEYIRLWQITDNNDYYDVIQRCTDNLDNGYTESDAAGNSKTGTNGRAGTLLPGFIQTDMPGILHGTYSFGAQSDSYYEYLIKVHHLIGDGVDQYKRMYTAAIDSAYEFLIRDVDVVPGEEGNLLTIGQWTWGSFTPTLDHLTCFAGAMLGLGSKLLERAKDALTAEKFTNTCFWAYNSSVSGIMPEALTFYEKKDPHRFQKYDSPDGAYIIPRGDPTGTRIYRGGYHLRPEAIESVFYMWRITGKKEFQDKAWRMFVAFVEATITSVGFSSIAYVHLNEPFQADAMESFALAETLKYFYLTFSETDHISLDEWVFNTEAHPFRLPRNDEILSPPFPFDPTLYPNLQSDYAPPSNYPNSTGFGTLNQLLWRIEQSKLEQARADAKHSVGEDQRLAENGIMDDGRPKPFNGGGGGRGMGGIGRIPKRSNNV